MTGRPDRPTRGELLSASVASVLSPALFVWPLHLTLVAGSNALLVLALAGCWAAVVAWWSLPVGQSAKAGGFVVLDGVAFVLILGIDMAAVSLLGTMLQVFFFFDTPRWALLVPLMALIGWWASRPLAASSRLVMLWTPVLLAGSLLVGVLGLSHMAYPAALWPSNLIRLPEVTGGLGVLAYMGVPLGVTLRRLGSRVPGARPVDGLGAVALLGVILGSLYALTVATLGPAALVRLRWPVVFTLEQITLDSAFFISRVGIAVIFGWTLAFMLGGLVHLAVISRVTEPPAWAAAIGAAGILVGAILLSRPTVTAHWLIGLWDPLCALYLAAELVMLAMRHWSTDA